MFSLCFLCVSGRLLVSSFQEALAHAGYSRVHVYNSKKKPELINNLGIFQLAAALTIAPHAVNHVFSEKPAGDRTLHIERA